MLFCENLSAKYEEKIFENLGFSLFPCSLMVLTGPNGSGKSTLLKVLGGLLKAESGIVEYEENFTPSYLGHKLGIKEELTVLDNIEFYAKSACAEQIILPAISYFQLNEIADFEAAKLSAGWKKRLALATLIAKNTNIWLLDEPEVNLDEDGKFRLKNLIESKVSNGGIVVMTTHNKDFLGKAPEIDMRDFRAKE